MQMLAELSSQWVPMSRCRLPDLEKAEAAQSALAALELEQAQEETQETEEEEAPAAPPAPSAPAPARRDPAEVAAFIERIKQRQLEEAAALEESNGENAS